MTLFSSYRKFSKQRLSKRIILTTMPFGPADPSKKNVTTENEAARCRDNHDCDGFGRERLSWIAHDLDILRREMTILRDPPAGSLCRFPQRRFAFFRF